MIPFYWTLLVVSDQSNRVHWWFCLIFLNDLHFSTNKLTFHYKVDQGIIYSAPRSKIKVAQLAWEYPECSNVHFLQRKKVSCQRDNFHFRCTWQQAFDRKWREKTVILHFLPRFNNLYIAKHKSLLVRVCPKTVACRFWYIVDITIQCNAVLLAWVAKLVKY